MPIGQTYYGHYIKHPPVASWRLADGDSLDAGSMHLTHSNLSYLSQVNCRHIGSVMGPGIVPLYMLSPGSPLTNPYDGIGDVSRPADISFSGNPTGCIPWDYPRNCLVLGPIPAVNVDYKVDPAGYRPRKIACEVQGYSQNRATGALYCVAAITVGAVSPAEQAPLDYATFAPSVGDFQTVTTFDLNLVVRLSRFFQCRPNASGADFGNTVTDLYLWIGWLAIDTNSVASPGSAIYNVEAWETY